MSSSLNTLTATSDIKTSPSLQTLEVDPAIESQVGNAAVDFCSLACSDLIVSAQFLGRGRHLSNDCTSLGVRA